MTIVDNIRYGLYVFAPFGSTLSCPVLSTGIALKQEGLLVRGMPESVLKVTEKDP